MKRALMGAGIVGIILCGFFLLGILGGPDAPTGSPGINAPRELPFQGSLAAYGAPYWSGEPGVYLNVSNVPPGDDFIAISRDSVTLALRSNGTIACWGDYREGFCDFPRDSGYQAVSSNGYNKLALRKNGTIINVGRPDPSGPPPGNDFVAVSMGGGGLALRANGILVQWDNPLSMKAPVPPGENFIAIDSGYKHNLALRQNGTIVCWGEYEDLCDVPSGNDYVAIATSGMENLALRANGEIVAWAPYGSYQYVPPGNDYVAISPCGRNSLALRSDGTIVCWGESPDYLCNHTTTQNVIAASMGSSRVLVLQNPHAKEILAEEWKKTRGRISPDTPVNSSSPAIHPAVYPNVPYVIDTVVPEIPASVWTYIPAHPDPYTIPTPIPYRSPVLSTTRFIPYKEFPIIGPEQAVTRLKTHRLSLDETFLWHNRIETSEKIVITNVTFNYFRQLSPSGISCLQPIYRFSGHVRNGTAQSSFTEDVPATDYLVEYDFL